ncbi:MAG TPA: hypothetical protein VLS27_17330 [Gammaproteobacteria bacterium]|nr:hypothetical protein [Gammaproteobacteria bacterium]
MFSAALSGCSVARLAYNHSDGLLLRKMDAYPDLSFEQITATRERLVRRLETQRQRELPADLDTLRRTRSVVEDGRDIDEAEWIIRQGRIPTSLTLERTVPAIAAALSSFSPAQIRHLEGHFEKVNRDFRRKYLSYSERE